MILLPIVLGTIAFLFVNSFLAIEIGIRQVFAGSQLLFTLCVVLLLIAAVLTDLGVIS